MPAALLRLRLGVLVGRHGMTWTTFARVNALVVGYCAVDMRRVTAVTPVRGDISMREHRSVRNLGSEADAEGVISDYRSMRSPQIT